jgi:hypothetical protein
MSPPPTLSSLENIGTIKKIGNINKPNIEGSKLKFAKKLDIMIIGYTLSGIILLL